MSDLKINFQYPLNDDYDYEAGLERINLDEERKKDLTTNKGFVISEPSNIKKDVKDLNGIYSTKFGQALNDIDPYANRYKCQCGRLRARILHGITCPFCNTKVKYIGDDFNYFGWMCLKDDYYVIHPNLFKAIEFFIGATRFNNIIKIVSEKDQDGFEVETVRPKDEPYFGIGLMQFKEQFDEIMNYYLSIYPLKKDYYDNIMEERNKVFTQSMPVFSTHLRPFRIENNEFSFEGTNAIYNMMTKLVASINKDGLKMLRKSKPKNQLLYDLQKKFNALYKELENIISGKKGSVNIWRRVNLLNCLGRP